jgi:N-acetylglucosaminyldiphosphoundecaprenol N-acetyl-beta-D-mannosaminyltransferase
VAKLAPPIPRHAEISGIQIFGSGHDEAVRLCIDAIDAGRQTKVATANLDFLALAARDGQLKTDLQRSSLVVADGMPVVWLARIAGAAGTRRVAGVDFVDGICRAASARGGLRLALYGSSDAVRAGAERHFGAIAGVTVCFSKSPPFRPLTAEERAADARAIAGSGAELVLVALGCPGQERFIAEAATGEHGPVWVGVGGSFDFFAGHRKRAPRLLQRTGMEWAVRMLQEPKRLGRRYLLRDLPALCRLAPACAAARIRTR